MYEYGHGYPDQYVHRLVEDVEHVNSPVAGEGKPQDQHRQGGHRNHLRDHCLHCHDN